jgi:hypothetical protein
MDDNETSMAIGNPRTEFEDPIGSLLIVINKLIDLESRMDYQSSTIQELQDNLRTIIDLLERSKK